MEEKKYTSKINKLRRRLYSRNRSSLGFRKQKLDKRHFNIPTRWDNDSTNSNRIDDINFHRVQEEMSTKKKTSFLNKVLIVTIIFFIAAAIYAFFSISGGGGVISSEKIDITVSGPISIAAGETLSLQVNIRNNNNVDLELADLLVEYPEGTREQGDIGKELKRFRKSLGDIKSGESAEEIIDSVLFGEEGVKKTIKIGVEYRVLGSNAIFFTEREYEVEIVSSPILMNVDSPSSVNSGQDIEFNVLISANSSNNVSNILFSAKYPFGFEFKSSNIEPSFDDNVWDLGTLTPGTKKTIRIRGRLVGQDDEERTFKFETGIPSENDEKIIGTAFLTHSASVVIKRPFVSIGVALDGSTADEYIGNVGERIRGDISWQNNIASKLSNVSVEVTLKGQILDKSSISSRDGFYRSTDDTIVWDSRSNVQLEALDAGETGSSSFTFGPKGISSIVGTNTSPEILLSATISGDSINSDGIPKRISTTINKRINISSSVGLSARAIYFTGPFINSGPMPPKVNRETTYTVTWSVSNLLNDITGTKVKATIPTYMRWMGVTSGGDIVYNPIGGEIVWNVGNVGKGVGFNSPSKEISFQLAFTPSISQIGKAPQIINNLELETQDTVTDERLTDSIFGINTILSSDPQFVKTQGVVVE